MRLRAKADNNQKEIVAGLRKIGAKVLHLHRLGQGAPDLLIGFRGKLYLIELKGAVKKLTPDEEGFHMEWTGYVSVCNNLNETLEVVTNGQYS